MRRVCLFVTIFITGLAGLVVSGAAASTPTGMPSSGERRVTLITGDVVRVSTTPDGRQDAAVERANPNGPGGMFESFNLGPDLYVVPQSAMPYLGSTLDLALFDVTNPPASVHVTYRPGASTQPITLGRSFGAALTRQWVADQDSATHTGGLFADVARISATATPTTAARAVTRSVGSSIMDTLTINGIGIDGLPASSATLAVYNVDDLTKFATIQSLAGGLVKLSVPQGHYAAFAIFSESVSGVGHAQVADIPQFVVSGDTSITLDARNATSPVSVSTPRPATPKWNEVGFGRTDKNGVVGLGQIFGVGTTQIAVQPSVKRVTIGQLHYYAYSRQFAADGSYTYDLVFPSDGTIPVNEQYVARDGDLATIDSSYPASHLGSTSRDTIFHAFPWQASETVFFFPFATPVERTEYYTALPDLFWRHEDFVQSTPSTAEYLSVWRIYTPGLREATTWAGTPVHPRLGHVGLLELDGKGNVFNQTFCPACLSGTRLDLVAYPYADNSPDHFGFQGVPGDTVGYGIYADDVLVQQGGFLSADVTMPAGAQTYRIDYNTTRASANFTLSTDVRTRWTIPASAPLAALPRDWACTSAANPPPSCGVLPLITNSYDLPVNLLGQLPSGDTTATLSLGHLPQGPGAGFTSVSVQVSYDSGQSWQPVTVTEQGSGTYSLAFTVPPVADSDGFGALQVSVQDALGGTFDQTIQHAFAIGS